MLVEWRWVYLLLILVSLLRAETPAPGERASFAWSFAWSVAWSVAMSVTS